MVNKFFGIGMGFKNRKDETPIFSCLKIFTPGMINQPKNTYGLFLLFLLRLW